MKGTQYQGFMISLKQTKYYHNKPTIKLFSHKRWKTLILLASENLKNKYPNKGPLIKDLQTIGKHIPEDFLIEATFGIKKFKPEFIEVKPILEYTTVSTMSQSIVKAAKFKNQTQKCCDEGFLKKFSVTEKTFSEEFNKKDHPLRFMIKNIRNLLELKYKSFIDRNKISLLQLQTSLKQDLEICAEFLGYTAQPYKELFESKNQDETTLFSKKFDVFFNSYIKDHPKILLTSHKILLYYSRHKYENKVNTSIPDIAETSQYQIPELFNIDGCYIRSMNSLMEFASYNEIMTPKKILSKLIEFRKNILNDIDSFYIERDGEPRQLQLNAEIQIQIIRFIIAKLKGWIPEIYSQLKFLENYFGDEDIAFKFEEASFIYVQLTMAFEILGFE